MVDLGQMLALCSLILAAPAPQDPQNTIFGLALGGPWEPIWHPVGINFGLWTRSGGFGGARWRHFGPIRSPLGFDVIFGPEI